MATEYFYGVRRTEVSKRAGKPMGPTDRQGTPAVGRVVRMLVGQGYGYIRLRDDRQVYFHRGDVGQGTTFNDLEVGDAVAFEVLEDPVSGARALRVARRRK